MRLKQMADAARFRFWRLRDRLRDQIGGSTHRRAVFRRYYEANAWGDPESASGSGSGAAATAAIRRELPGLFRRLGVRSILDAPCGDFFWMRDVVGALDRYHGVDIVPGLIERNQAAFGSAVVSFACVDIAADPLPRADLVLCRDCFIHLPTRLIRAALSNFRRTGARYLLLTHDEDAEPYRDIPVGSFRRIDFTRPPFGFPPPSWALDEGTGGGRRLGLWELAHLPIAGTDRGGISAPIDARTREAE